MFASLLQKTHHAVGRVTHPGHQFRNKQFDNVVNTHTPERPDEELRQVRRSLSGRSQNPHGDSLSLRGK